MAEALIQGIKAAGMDTRISVGEQDEARREYLIQKGIDATSCNIEAIQGTEFVVIATKPQQLDKVTKELREFLEPHQVVISILAGIRTELISAQLQHEKVVRVMPNTPVQVRQGMSVWYAPPKISDTTVNFITAMLRAVGDELRVEDEKYLDAATALSGSGPAYVFLFLEAMKDAGVEMGFSASDSIRISLQNMRGAIDLMLAVGKHPAELKSMVTSPGGTTSAGLLSMEKNGLRTAVIEGILSARQRAEKLADGRK